MTESRRPDSLSDLSLGEQAAIARVEEALFGDASATPPRVGRYEIVEAIGRGAFGRVYRARDPNLDRGVAIKILPEADTAAAQERLIGEAKIMATVGHPNVATVYDAGVVGEGTDARVFIAMELVAGKSLRAWLSESHSPHDVIDVLAQAGRGLAAAHAAGVVHGDFKPENVLLGDDGRVRVVDFGLARPFDADATPNAGAAHSRDVIVTATGGLVGTPAYMAPEQHRGQAPNARSDQFAFGVVLWEALAGRRPFPGDTVAEVADAVCAGHRRAWQDHRPSARIQRCIDRALEVDPDRRHDSMADLLRALDRRGPRPRLWLGAAAAAALFVAAGVMIGGSGEPPDPCRTAAAGMTEVWNDTLRSELQAAFRGSGATYADRSFATAVRVLDRYSESWSLARVDACEATHVHRSRSADLLERQTECFRDRLGAMAAVVDTLGRADATIVARATQIVDGLPGLAACSDVESLAAVADMPRDAESRQQIGAVRAQLARARALHVAGKSAEALEVVQEAEREADQLRYPPLQAAANIWMAEVLQATGKSEESWTAARAGFDLALAGEDRRSALWAASLLAFGGAMDPRQKQEALRWVETARSLLTTVHDPALEAKIYNAEGNAHLTAGDAASAKPAFDRAVELFRAIDPDDPNIGSSVAMLGIVSLQLGDVPAALEHLRDALERNERTLGSSHPSVASTLVNLSLAESAQGNYARAEQLIRRALSLHAETSGKNSPYAVYYHLNLGQVLVRRGHLDAAAPEYTEAARIAPTTFGPTHPLTGQVTMAQAELAARRGDGRLGTELGKRALSLLEAAMGRQTAPVATCEATVAFAYRVAGDPRRALAHARAGVAAAAAALDEADPMRALPMRELGEAQLLVDDVDAAVATLEAAERLLSARPVDPHLMTEVRFALSRALSRTAKGDRRETAAAVARQALAELPADSDAALRGRLERWLHSLEP